MISSVRDQIQCVENGHNFKPSNDFICRDVYFLKGDGRGEIRDINLSDLCLAYRSLRVCSVSRAV
jgi:hypothetical protein